MNLIEFFSTLGIFSITIGQSIMILVGLLLIYLAINKKFEPLLLLPIGFGALLTNIPEIGLSMSPIEKLIYANNPSEISTVISELSISGLNLSEFLKNASFSELQHLNIAAQNLGYSPGILYIFYETAIGSGIAPLLIFMGVGAMTDFGPLLANPKTLILGAAAQFGIFATVMGALLLDYYGLIEFTLKQAAATGIIGGADGPTAIYEYAATAIGPNNSGARIDETYIAVGPSAPPIMPVAAACFKVNSISP